MEVRVLLAAPSDLSDVDLFRRWHISGSRMLRRPGRWTILRRIASLAPTTLAMLLSPDFDWSRALRSVKFSMGSPGAMRALVHRTGVGGPTGPTDVSSVWVEPLTIIAELEKRRANIVISQHPRRAKPLDIDLDMYKWRHLENFFCHARSSSGSPCAPAKPTRASKP